MGWISAIFVHKVIDVATGIGGEGVASRHHLLGSLRLNEADEVDPAKMVDAKDFFGLLESIAERTELGRSVPIQVGASMRCDDYGAFGLAFKSAVDLEGSYLRVERYGRVVTSISNFRLVEQGSSSLMEVIPDDEARPGLLMTNELALAAATALSREVSVRGFAPAAAHFSQPAPTNVSAFEEHFQCPLRFNAERDALELTRHQLQQPNQLGDLSISRFFDVHLDETLCELPAVRSLERRVQTEITQALSQGVLPLEQLAGRLGMSRRTLQRRLGESGHTYRQLVDRSRQDLSLRLLRSTEYQLAEIAFLAGFSEQSAFTRAVKRWTETTPQAYRQEHARPS